MLLSHYLDRYLPAIRRLPADRPLSAEDLLAGEFRMERSGLLETHYAPHNEYLEPTAKVIIIGITPGLTQMKQALLAARRAMENGAGNEEICRIAKQESSFAGTMRRNLIAMLDGLGLHRQLRLPSTEELFGAARDRLHTTSLLRFPVFAAGRNYTGSRPRLASTEPLTRRAVANIREELGFLHHPLIIPLGSAVESILRLLEREGKLDSGRCLWGFPHPSGANGHRHAQFSSRAEKMRTIIASVEAGS
jgi:hypothetical protein